MAGNRFLGGTLGAVTQIAIGMSTVRQPSGKRLSTSNIHYVHGQGENQGGSALIRSIQCPDGGGNPLNHVVEMSPLR
jgi:hypothetical protein